MPPLICPKTSNVFLLDILTSDYFIQLTTVNTNKQGREEQREQRQPRGLCPSDGLLLPNPVRYPGISSYGRHKPRKYRIEPNPMPSRIRGITFSLNPWSRRSDTITPLKEITLSCLRPATPDGKITAFPRNSVRSKIAPTTTAVIRSRTPPIIGLSWVLSTSGAPANTKKKHGRNV